MVKHLFLYNSKEYTEFIPKTTFKEYPKYNYIPHKTNRKPQYLELVSLNLTNLSRETPFIFKGDPGYPRTSILAKVILISFHKYIKIIIYNYYLICRNSTEVQTAQLAIKKNIVYKNILKLSGETLEEVNPTSIEGPKNVRGTKTL